MRIITKTALEAFWKKNPESETPLIEWSRIVKNNSFLHFAALRETFPSADQVDGKYTVFNIGGNKYRLVTAIHYNAQKVFIRAVLTHKEYNKGKWKE